MSAYEQILTLEPSMIDLLLLKGYMRSSVRRDLTIYKFYINERISLGYLQARTNTAEKFFTSEETVARIIQRMK